MSLIVVMAYIDVRQAGFKLQNRHCTLRGTCTSSNSYKLFLRVDQWQLLKYRCRISLKLQFKNIPTCPLIKNYSYFNVR